MSTPLRLEEIKTMTQGLLVSAKDLAEKEDRIRAFIRDENNTMNERATAIRYFAAFFFDCSEALTQDDPDEFIVTEFLKGDADLQKQEKAIENN